MLIFLFFVSSVWFCVSGFRAVQNRDPVVDNHYHGDMNPGGGWGWFVFVGWTVTLLVQNFWRHEHGMAVWLVFRYPSDR